MDGGHQEYMWQLSGNDGPDVEWEYVPIPGPSPPPPPVKEVNLPRIEYILECIQYGGNTPKTRMEEPVYSARYIFFIFHSLVIKTFTYIQYIYIYSH